MSVRRTRSPCRFPSGWRDGTVAAPTVAEVEAAFDTAYMATYGRLLKNGTRRVMNLRTAVIGRRPKFDLARLRRWAAASRPPAAAAARCISAMPGTTRRSTTGLPCRSAPRSDGPAILVQPDTTVLIDPGLTGRVDAFGNTIIAPREEA
jgi:N-methylhydantoinase A